MRTISDSIGGFDNPKEVFTEEGYVRYKEIERAVVKKMCMVGLTAVIFAAVCVGAILLVSVVMR